MFITLIFSIPKNKKQKKKPNSIIEKITLLKLTRLKHSSKILSKASCRFCMYQRNSMQLFMLNIMNENKNLWAP